MILFVSGDVGGARCLLPVIKQCALLDWPLVVMDYGVLSSEAPMEYRRILPPTSKVTLKEFLVGFNLSVLVFTSSVHDTLALSLARTASAIGIPVLHVLDNWSGYGLRMKMDGKTLFIPDIYTVIDSVSFEGAIRDGIPKETLRVVGHPVFAELQDFSNFSDASSRFKQKQKLGIDPGKVVFAYFSEPVAKDQGANPLCPNFRGYTEENTLRLFCRALQPLADIIHILLVPHPRENRAKFFNEWKTNRGKLQGEPSSMIKGRDTFCVIDAAAGMASILLYEAWLLGCPVVSIQPGLKDVSLRRLERCEDVLFIDNDSQTDVITNWASRLSYDKPRNIRKELSVHMSSALRIATLINELGDTACRN